MVHWLGIALQAVCRFRRKLSIENDRLVRQFLSWIIGNTSCVKARYADNGLDYTHYVLEPVILNSILIM